MPSSTPKVKTKYDIQEAAKRLKLSPQYVRSLIRSGMLKSAFEPIVPESLVNKHMVTEAEIQRYLAIPSSKTQRKDHRNKYVIYMTMDERQRVADALKAADLADVESTIRTANVLKPRKETENAVDRP